MGCLQLLKWMMAHHVNKLHEKHSFQSTSICFIAQQSFQAIKLASQTFSLIAQIHAIGLFPRRIQKSVLRLSSGSR